MSTRAEIYAAIDGERLYQDEKWGGDLHSGVEWLAYIQDYTQEALHFNARQADVDAIPFTRHTLRKIAAMAVAAMEQLGAAHRSAEGPRPVGTTQ